MRMCFYAPMAPGFWQNWARIFMRVNFGHFLALKFITLYPQYFWVDLFREHVAIHATSETVKGYCQMSTTNKKYLLAIQSITHAFMRRFS